MIVKRKYWIANVEKAWQERSIVWLSGVRRVGKTMLSQSLAHISYFDCELPSVREKMSDPEKFLATQRGKRIVLDEIHRLCNPSELLKIAADHFPTVKIIATGSSSLSASVKFKDTLAGRKTELWLTPMIAEDLKDFRRFDLKHRLIFGGLPPFFLSRKLPERYFQEWIDAYWAKDIQELFRLERRQSFQKFLELLMIQSGGIFEANKFANPCEVSRTTIANYLSVLEETYVAHVLRPYSTYRKTEIVAAPKVYMFDTGFVSYYRGLHDLKTIDLGLLWEHYVLNELQANLRSRQIRYWRDKQGHEVDFIVVRRGQPPLAIEAKLNSRDFDSANLRVFLRQYPQSQAFVVTNDLGRSFTQDADGMSLSFMKLSNFINLIGRQTI